jgi:hypothetical protein
VVLEVLQVNAIVTRKHDFSVALHCHRNWFSIFEEIKEIA